MDQDSAQWRLPNFSRPWYQKAMLLLPDLTHKKVLELGSGHGELAKILKPKVKSYTATDLSSKYVKQLNNQGFTAVQADFNQKLPFKNKQFDLVITLEVVEHLAKAEEFLAEINRVLNPKGLLIISTPNIAWWGYRLFCLLGQPPKKEGYHLRFFTHHTMIKLLKKNNFIIKKSASFTTIPLINRFLPKPIYPIIKTWPNLLAQNLVFLCQKK
ncbi:class I SAM-dependent methyltransferase [Patescibacteria group bacterium]